MARRDYVHALFALLRSVAWAMLAGAVAGFVAIVIGVLLVHAHLAVDAPALRYRTSVAAAVAAMAAALAVLAWRTNRGSENALVGRWHPPLRYYVIAVAAALAVRGLAWVLISVSGLQPAPSWTDRYFDRAGTEWPAWVIAVLAIALVVPILEELVFRRGMYRLLDRFSPRLAFVVSAVSFALVHPPGARVMALFAGAIAALLYQRAGSVLPSIAFHGSANLGALALYAALH